MMMIEGTDWTQGVVQVNSHQSPWNPLWHAFRPAPAFLACCEMHILPAAQIMRWWPHWLEYCRYRSPFLVLSFLLRTLLQRWRHDVTAVLLILLLLVVDLEAVLSPGDASSEVQQSARTRNRNQLSTRNRVASCARLSPFLQTCQSMFLSPPTSSLKENLSHIERKSPTTTLPPRNQAMPAVWCNFLT